LRGAPAAEAVEIGERQGKSAKRLSRSAFQASFEARSIGRDRGAPLRDQSVC